ncbi:MAG TPA: ATP-dependent helicase HrpB [Bryobacteraceae bacterium]|nr:ATP-dependent helicase HrpB [Bryobacteraceae bacterium]
MLPIDALLPEILAHLRRGPNLVIEAAPGAGKTTRVPPALLTLGPGDVLVLEPRRIAARMAARRVSEEMGEQVGGTVGYQVRFEEVAGPQTRLRFLTEGVLTRRLISDPRLKSVSTVVLDEFHERHLDTDLALTLLRRLQLTSRPDLRIVVMSATLDPAPIAAYLGDCPCVSSEGRLYELRVTHTAYSPAPLEEQVSGALESVVTSSPGDILVFLPGAAEIRRAARNVEGLARRHNLLIAPLYGDLSPEEQDRAVAPATQRKVILSTNLAESSITIEGVRAVIDSGLARVASDSPWTGVPSLEVKRISKASADQRAGRAGRTGPGIVVRLYTAEDFHRRPARDLPEILRRELSQLCLQLEVAGIHDPTELDWLDAPPAAALDAAERLLDRLRARDEEARRMAQLPLPPRLARLLLDAKALRAGQRGARIAAILSSGQRIQTLDDEPDQRTRAVFSQLRRFTSTDRDTSEAAIGRALLAAFPDRVGRARPGGTVLLSNGTSATIQNPPGEFLVAIDLEERNDKPASVIRLAHAIQPDWLLDLFPERVVDRTQVEWHRQGERVESVSAMLYDTLVIDETRGAMPDPEAAATLLASKVIEAGLERFVDPAELALFHARVEFAAQHSSMEPLEGAVTIRAIEELCYGLRSFAEFSKASDNLLPTLERSLNSALLEQIAPNRLRLPSGRVTKVNYETGKPPWVASRLQDFFGMTETPRVARGAVPLVVHLLAPNQRPVQTTTDLAGFWQRLYPQLRRELGRRYPRHAWPENPLKPSE